MASPQRPAPLANIPPSNSTVTISAIDSTLFMSAVHTTVMWNPPIKGFERVRCGCWSILIEHAATGRKLLYDLGMRKDYRNVAPATNFTHYIDSGIVESITVERNVAEILEEGGVARRDIEGVIWSHFHFDHTGDVSTFPKDSTKLIVGPGTKDNFMPGWPTNPDAQTLDSDFEGRAVEEIDFSSARSDVLDIGRFRGVDYFGDGSFYLLDAPGHTIGHLNALARTSVEADGTSTFILLGGDSAHHAAEIRPSEFLPLPESIEPSPVPHVHALACPGHAFSSILRGGSTSAPILQLHDPTAETLADKKFSMIYNEPDLRETIRKDEEFDAEENVFTLLAHDWSLKGLIDEWPKNLNSWQEQGLKKKAHWKFLEDFAAVIES